MRRFPFPALAVSTLAVLLTTVVAPRPVDAEPYLAVRTGFKCAVCHVNGIGGGKRTGYGSIYSQTTLPRWIVKGAPNATAFDPNLNEYVSVGGDLRVVNTTSIRKTGDDTNEFATAEANLYVQIDAVPDFLTFYVDETFAPGETRNREAFLMVQTPAKMWYVRAGRLLLPYGLRLWDDEAFIRQKTGFTYQSQDLGVELGWQPKSHEFAVAFTNGTQAEGDNNRDKQISVVGTSVFRRFRIGGSFSHNESPAQNRTIWGIFGGINFGRFTMLGEFDVIQDDVEAGTPDYGDQRLVYFEGNLLIAKGVNVKFAWDWWDPFTEVEEDTRAMYRIGVEPFLTQFLQARAFFRYRDAPPQLVTENFDDLTIELHAFF